MSCCVLLILPGAPGRALAGQAVSNIKADGGTGPFGVLLEGRLNVDVVALNPRNSHKSKKESKKTNQATGMAAGGVGATRAEQQ